jgi:putative two-component system response regulator
MASETILIVEDNRVLLDGLKDLLEGEEYQVFCASTGLEGLERMETHAPDLILSDVIMPEMDGYEFFEVVRSKPEWVSIPFIFITARRERESLFTGKKLGAEDYLLKPISPDELLTTVRSRLSRSQQLMLLQLTQAYEASLIVLANAIEVRDPYTRGHVERVMNYSLEIAGYLNLTPMQMHDLRFGSILHDIGKIQISETILNKKGPLTKGEWEEMKKHPNMGVELIDGIHYLSPAIPVIQNHHERWDGSGYPAGRSGKDIPLVARIAAVADSFDAMTSQRPYRPAMTSGQACQEIKDGCDGLYDPQVVEAFQSAYASGKIQAVLEAFP